MKSESSRSQRGIFGYLEVLKSMWPTITSVSVLFSAATVFFYCLRIGFTPADVAGSGVLHLVAVLFALVVLVGFGLVIGTISVLWIVRLMLCLFNWWVTRKRAWGKKYVGASIIEWRLVEGWGSWGGFCFSLLGFLMILGTALLVGRPSTNTDPLNTDPLLLLLCFLLGGWVFSSAFVVHVRAGDAYKESVGLLTRQYGRIDRKQALLLAGAALVVMFAYSGQPIVCIALNMVDIRDAAHVVGVNNENYSRLMAAAKLSDRPLQSCKHPASDMWLIKNLVIEWQKIGTVSRVKLVSDMEAVYAKTRVLDKAPPVDLVATGLWVEGKKSSKTEVTSSSRLTTSWNGDNCWKPELVGHFRFPVAVSSS